MTALQVPDQECTMSFPRLVPALTLFLLCLTALAAAWQQTLRIEADDLMRFKPTRLTATAGSDLTVELVNTGRIQSLQHNFVLLAQGTDIARFGNAAMNAKANGYIPKGMKDQVIAYTGLVAPGQSAKVTFKVPGPGTYTYICSYPGHFSSSKGTLQAE